MAPILKTYRPKATVTKKKKKSRIFVTIVLDSFCNKHFFLISSEPTDDVEIKRLRSEIKEEEKLNRLDDVLQKN